MDTSAELRDLEDCNPLITSGRDTGNGYYITARKYPTGDVEATAIKLCAEDKLRKGGGAKRINTSKKDMEEVVLSKSQLRAKKTVRQLCLSMQADRMLTLTVRQDLSDIDKAWKCFKYFNKLMRWRWPNRWQYVAAPEYQKRGVIHFHVAIRDYYHANTVRKLWNRALGSMDGNIDITTPRKVGKNPKKIANYISKYITKEDAAGFNRRRYSSGGKIEIPAPINGWLALGAPVTSIMCDVLKGMTRKPLQQYWESEGYFDIIFVST